MSSLPTIVKIGKVSRPILILLAICLTLLPWRVSFAIDAVVNEIKTEESSLERSNRLVRQKALFHEQIVALESEVGQFDQALLEPLQGLTRLMIEIEEYQEAGRILNRQLNLVRISEGLKSPRQLPILDQMMAINMRQEHWQDLISNFRSISLIQEQNPRVDTITVLDAMNDLRNLHLFFIFYDEPENISSHSIAIGKLQKRILTIAEDKYDDQNPLLIHWLYQDAIDEYRISVVNRSPGLTSGRSFREQSVINGLNNVQRIRHIVKFMDDPEADAMAMIYEADFMMLAMRNASGLELYLEAIDKLEQSGIAEEDITDFFSRPVVLPVAQFHYSLKDALAEQLANGFAMTPGKEGKEATVHMGSYLAWSTVTPGIRFPTIPEQLTVSEMKISTVKLRFTISPRDTLITLRTMKIRPALIDKQWQEMRDVTLHYLAPLPRHKIKSCQMRGFNLTDRETYC